MYLGTAIRRLREERGWSQEALAANIPGLHQSELSRIENNKKHPDWGQIEAFATAFGIGVEILLQAADAIAPQPASEDETELHALQKEVLSVIKVHWETVKKQQKP